MALRYAVAITVLKYAVAITVTLFLYICFKTFSTKNINIFNLE